MARRILSSLLILLQSNLRLSCTRSVKTLGALQDEHDPRQNQEPAQSCFKGKFFILPLQAAEMIPPPCLAGPRCPQSQKEIRMGERASAPNAIAIVYLEKLAIELGVKLLSRTMGSIRGYQANEDGISVEFPPSLMD